MGRALVILVIMASLLAGCVAEQTPDLEPGADGELPEPGEDDDDAVLAGRVAPSWAPGHYWAYTTSFGVDFALVVSHDHGEDWYVDTTSQDLAWFHVQNELSYLGEIRKSDLAGSQGNDRVEFLKFPLEEGQEWTTRWDGVDRRIRVVEAGDVFHLEGHEADTLRVSYTYDPSKAWFTEFSLHAPDGAAVFTMTLTEHRTDWSGDVHRWDAGLFWESTSEGIGAGGGSGAFEVPEGLTDLWVRVEWSCTGNVGLATLFLVPVLPPSTDHALLAVAPTCEDQGATIEILEAPAAAVWHAGVYRASVEDDAIAALEVWGRTLETMSAPW